MLFLTNQQPGPELYNCNFVYWFSNIIPGSEFKTVDLCTKLNCFSNWKSKCFIIGLSNILKQFWMEYYVNNMQLFYYTRDAALCMRGLSRSIDPRRLFCSLAGLMCEIDRYLRGWLIRNITVIRKDAIWMYEWTDTRSCSLESPNLQSCLVNFGIQLSCDMGLCF